MKHFRYIIATLVVLLASPAIQAFDATYYLVRHAEKQKDGTPDPALTNEGIVRAQAIAHLLKDVKFDAIYSTDFKRTQATAAPTAIQSGLNIISYDANPGKFEAFIEQMGNKDGVFLVVGHSNTTPVIASVLSGQSFPELDERQYDHLYIVTRGPDGEKAAEIIYTDPRTP